MSLLLFLTVSATMASTYVGHLQRSTQAEIRTLAVAAAQRALDELRLQDPGALPTSGSTSQTIVIDNKNFTVQTSYCVTVAFCASAANRHLRIQVSHLGGMVFETETVFTRLR